MFFFVVARAISRSLPLVGEAIHIALRFRMIVKLIS